MDSGDPEVLAGTRQGLGLTTQVLFLFLSRLTANSNLDTGNPKLSEIESWVRSPRLKLTSGRRRRHLRAGVEQLQGAEVGCLLDPRAQCEAAMQWQLQSTSPHQLHGLLGLSCHTRPLLLPMAHLNSTWLIS